MSELRGRRSPYEQGELKPSPERHSKKKKSSKKSKKSHQLPPEAKLHIRTADEDDDVQVIEAADHGEEEGGSLTIKPPQLQVQKREKRHKRDKHRFREHGSSRERGRVEKTDIIKDKWKAHPPARDFRDAREIVREKKKERELKEKELSREMKEREERKREESIKERERLERLELERRRERQMREDHEKDKQARQQKRKDDRRQIIDSRRERAKVGDERQMSEHHRSRSRDRERARDKGQTRHFPPPPRLQEDKVSKKEKAYSSAPKSLSKSEDVEIIDVEQDTRRVVVEEPTEEKLKKRERKVEEVEDSVSEKRDAAPLAGKRLARESPSKDAAAAEEEEEESEESDSDSGESGSDTSSGDEESSEEEEDDDEDDEEEDEKVPDEEEQVGRKAGPGKQEDIHEDSRDKLRSKFDDHSDAESPVLGSDHTPDDYMIPDSPDMSDVELAPEDALPLYLPAIQGCRSVEEFNCLNRIEEGTYGVVYRALDKKTNEIVALKRLKMEKEKEGFPITSLREINTLLKAQHENIVTVREIVVGSNMDKIYIVMDFVEHDLKSLMENMKNPFLVGEVKTLIQQLLRATRHLHDNWILHRDLKTSNLLLSHKGILKVGDFGLAREYGSPLRHYTPVVVTLWYRAPELLLGCKEYSTHVDMWSVGCIFAELLLRKALWPGKSEIDQINKIFKDLGTPTEKIWPGVSELPGMKKINFHDNPYNVIRNRFGSYFTDHGFDLLNRFFAYDPVKRITADEALDHEYFRESPLPVDPSMFPTWPARSEQTRKHSSSPKPPSGGKAYQKLLDDEENFAAGGFHMPSAAKGVSAQGMGFSLKF